FCYRGSLGTRPVQDTDAGVTQHQILNVAAMNPLYSLKYALRQYRAGLSHSGQNRFITNAEVPLATTSLSGVLTGEALATETDQLADHPMWQRTAGGPANGPPEHVFVLFMESYDSWPFQDKYDQLNIVPFGEKLAHEGL